MRRDFVFNLQKLCIFLYWHPFCQCCFIVMKLDYTYCTVLENNSFFISDPRRGCFMGLSMFIFLFFFFFFFFFLLFFSFFSATILSSPYLWNRYSQRLQIGCAAWSCGLVLHYCLPSNSLRYFFFYFFFLIVFFFFAKILSGSYLWNRYSQRLQIECAAWFCSLVLHYWLPSNSLHNFFFFSFFFLFFRHDFVRAISLELLLAETPN